MRHPVCLYWADLRLRQGACCRDEIAAQVVGPESHPVRASVTVTVTTWWIRAVRRALRSARPKDDPVSQYNLAPNKSRSGDNSLSAAPAATRMHTRGLERQSRPRHWLTACVCAPFGERRGRRRRSTAGEGLAVTTNNRTGIATTTVR
jgi:hypothetical protein